MTIKGSGFAMYLSETCLTSSCDSTPTEQEIRDCFAPLYNTGGATDATTLTDGGSTADTGDESSDGEGSSTDSDPSGNEE